MEGLIHKQFLLKQLRGRVQELLEHDIKHVLEWKSPEGHPTAWLDEINNLLSLDWKLGMNIDSLKKSLETMKAKEEVRV